MSKHNVVNVLSDGSVPIGHRIITMVDLMVDARDESEKHGPNAEAAAEEVFDKLASQAGDGLAAERAEMLKAILDQVSSAPLRLATFIRMDSLDGSPAAHALVGMEGGGMACVVAPNQEAARKLKLGDLVMVDAKAKLLVGASGGRLGTGMEAKLERKLDGCRLEVILHQDERAVLLAGPAIMDGIDSGKIKPGARLVVDNGSRFALSALPPDDEGLAYYKFLDRGAIPNVSVDRDIGAPPKVIGEVARHVLEEMTRPNLRRKFKLRPCITRLLCGVSGTGKTLSVQAIHRLLYEIMSKVTGVPVEKLPPRVFRMKSSQMLSMWFGESDKNIDRLFDEVEQLASEPFVGRKGKKFQLPVMVVLEEADAMGRARGQDSDGIYDRIMTVVLQRLDPNREGLSDKLVVFLSTTNEPKMVDPAFLRRIGGRVEAFGCLEQEGFLAILAKHVEGLPGNGWKEIIHKVSHRLFDDDRDQGVVAVNYHNQPTPVIKRRKDFLTGALVDRSVQQASESAWEMSLDQPDTGITATMLLSALDRQIGSVVDQLHTENLHHYTDLPEGVRVTRIERLKADPLAFGG
jgi:ATP-dependent 26S proteasome regulatory subunit